MTAAASMGSRVAGKVLGDYLSGVGKMILGGATALGAKAAGATSNIPFLQTLGAGTAEEASKAIAGIPLIGKALAAAPVSVPTWQAAATHAPKAVGALTTGGTLLGGVKVLPGLINSIGFGSEDSSQRIPPFATSQYMPGRLPLTNEQAGEMLLNQQRFQQQMQLIQARQSASTPQMQQAEELAYSPLNASSVGNVSRALQQTYNY